MDQNENTQKDAILKTSLESVHKQHFQYVRKSLYTSHSDASLLRELILNFLKDKPKPPPEDEPRLFP